VTALNFPNAPVPGQQFPVPGVPGVQTWRWDGEKWLPIGSTGGTGPVVAAIYIADVPPVGAPDNSLWWDSTDGRTYVRYEDQWVQNAGMVNKIAGPIPGTASYTEPGDFQFVVPNYNTLTLDLHGAGGGGGEAGGLMQVGTSGEAGAASVFFGPDIIQADSGEGGQGGGSEEGEDGADGGGFGGEVTEGGGGAGGDGGVPIPVIPATSAGGKGGNGGKVTRTWYRDQPGSPLISQSYQILIGTRGRGGWDGENFIAGWGNSGQHGSAQLSWN
jgi:hypothetical protein